MATVDYDPMFQPLRGKILGTVFQTGRNAPVIKGKNSSQGQRLNPFEAAKANFQHASSLWKYLAALDRIAWEDAAVDFPTIDRYGNPHISDGFQLFMRAIGPMPRSLQAGLTSPGSPFAGTLPPPPTLTLVGGVLQLTTMDAPSGENFNCAVFCSRPVQPSTFYPKPSFRQISFFHDFSGSLVEDLTTAYNAIFEPAPDGSQIFFEIRTWKTGTPELLDLTTGHVLVETPVIYIADLISGYRTALGTMKVQSAYFGRAIRVNGVDYDFTDLIYPVASLPAPSTGAFYDQILLFQSAERANFVRSTPPYVAYNEQAWSQTTLYPTLMEQPYTYAFVVKRDPSIVGSQFELIRRGAINVSPGSVVFQGDGIGRFSIRAHRTTSIQLQYPQIVFDTDPHLYVVTYDGSRTPAGYNFYLDDMTTPQTPSAIIGTTVAAGAQSITFRQWFRALQSPPATSVSEVHQIDHVCNQAERDLIKAFFKQNPLYSSIAP